MPSVYDLKPRFQAMLRPLVRYLAKRGVTANQITLSAAGLSLLAGGMLLVFADELIILLAVPVVLFVRMALNAIDGMLAREHDMKTPLGAILNELGDVVSDMALYLPLACWSGIAPWVAVSFVCLALLTEMAGVISVQIGASRRYDGPMGKSDRAFLVGLLSFLAAFSWVSVTMIGWGLLVGGALSLWTLLNRCRGALAEVAS